MNYKVSVLVAVYNAEKYINKCLDSLLHQTLKEVQIICIDDASTDNSLAILQEYQQKYPEIIVLTQETNQGQAKARNKGLKVATGEFVTMTDSDDWLSEDALEKAYNVAMEHPDADAVLFELYYYDEATGTLSPYFYKADKRVYSGKEATLLSLDWKIHGLYIIRNSIHQAYPYDDSSLLYSDDNTTRLHFLHSREVHFSTGIYYYRQHNQSMTNSPTIRRFDRMDAASNLKKLLVEENAGKELIAMQENIKWQTIVGSYMYYLENKRFYTAKEHKEIKERIKKHLNTIELPLLKRSYKYKPGYWPFKGMFPLFLLEGWLYFRSRKIVYKIMGKQVPPSI